jgi:LacI family transcriptional regulator
VTAISRALNNHDDISPETRSHIRRVSQEMGYTPNLLARRLQKQTTDTLALILPVLSPRNSDPFFSELLVGIANEAADGGFDLLVSTCPPGPEESQTYNRLIESRRVDGIIVARPRWHDPRLDVIAAKQFPCIVIGATGFGGTVLTVSDDMAEGANIIVKHLANQGHEKIGIINTPPDLISSSNFLSGFEKAILEAKLTINDNWLQTSDFTPKDGYRAGQILLSKSEIPTAIVTADDVIALGVMAAAQDQGLEVGHDLAITGYGNILLTEHSQPPLTTIQRTTYTLGQQACRMLIAKLQGQPISDPQLVFKPSLIIRQSSDLALWL